MATLLLHPALAADHQAAQALADALGLQVVPSRDGHRATLESLPEQSSCALPPILGGNAA